MSTIGWVPGISTDLSFASIHRSGRLVNMAGDGSRIIAYRNVFPGLRQEKLVLMRYANGKVRKLKELPLGEFEDVDGDGVHEVISRERPLGPLFMVQCKGFHTMAPEAYRTSVWGWRDGKFVNVSGEYPDFFGRRIREARARVGAIDPRSTQDYGGYLGLTLSLFFDYDELGRGREGWREFRSLFPVRRSDPGVVKRCLGKMEDRIRGKLRIPSDW